MARTSRPGREGRTTFLGLMLLSSRSACLSVCWGEEGGCWRHSFRWWQKQVQSMTHILEAWVRPMFTRSVVLIWGSF